MVTALDVLAEIEQRADLAKRDESLIWLGDHDEALKLAIPEARERLIEKDAPAMVAALRAVLDELDRARREYQKSREACRGSVWSPRPVVYEPDVRAIITEALGGGA